MISPFFSPLTWHSLAGGAFVGAVYAVIFVWEKKRQYRKFNETSRKKIVYTSIFESVLTRVFFMLLVLGMTRYFHLNFLILLLATVVTFPLVVVFISKRHHEY